MGCGQSHIAVIYPRKAKAKSSGSGGSEESEDEVQACEAASNPIAEESPETSESEEEQRLRIHITSSPLIAQPELSSSQSDFFKMLDEKINNGADYDMDCGEYEVGMDQAQLCRLLQEWQAAKLRSKCGLVEHTNMARHKLQRYHSVQSNGEAGHRRLTHQMSASHHVGPNYYPQYYPPPPPHYQANSVVMYDKRGLYYTELA